MVRDGLDGLLDARGDGVADDADDFHLGIAELHHLQELRVGLAESAEIQVLRVGKRRAEICVGEDGVEDALGRSGAAHGVAGGEHFAVVVAVIVGAAVDQDDVGAAHAGALDEARAEVMAVPVIGGVALVEVLCHGRVREREVHVEDGVAHVVIDQAVPPGLLHGRDVAVVGIGVVRGIAVRHPAIEGRDGVADEADALGVDGLLGRVVVGGDVGRDGIAVRAGDPFALITPSFVHQGEQCAVRHRLGGERLAFRTGLIGVAAGGAEGEGGVVVAAGVSDVL